MDFNHTKDQYRELIEKSIQFSGQSHDFFLRVKADRINEIGRLSNSQRLLDIGCGHGYIHSMLEKQVFEIVGVDVAEDVLTMARSQNPDLKYVSYDGTTLPFEENQFDLALTMCVMHHVPPTQWKQFLCEMKRVLKPGGIALIFEHNPYNPLTQFVVKRNPLDDDAVLLSRSRLEKLAMNVGFQTVKSRFLFFTPFAHPFFRSMDQKLGWLPLGAQYYTIGVK